MKKLLTILLLLALGYLFIGFLVHFVWGLPTEKEAIAVFLEKNPKNNVLSAIAGEGNDDSVYYHFDFTKPNDEKVHKEIWLFMKQEDGTWKVTNREIPKE